MSVATSTTRTVGKSVCTARAALCVRGRRESARAPRSSSRCASHVRLGTSVSHRRYPREWVPRAEGISWHSVASEARGGSFATRTESTARPSWGGARALRRGGGVVGERRTLRRARGIELVSSSCCRREPGQPGRFQRRQRRRGGPDPGRHDEGHPPRVEVTCGRDLFRHGGQSSPGTARRW